MPRKHHIPSLTSLQGEAVHVNPGVDPKHFPEKVEKSDLCSLDLLLHEQLVHAFFLYFPGKKSTIHEGDTNESRVVIGESVHFGR